MSLMCGLTLEVSRAGNAVGATELLGRQPATTQPESSPANRATSDATPNDAICEAIANKVCDNGTDDEAGKREPANHPTVRHGPIFRGTPATNLFSRFQIRLKYGLRDCVYL
ncbi:hypothetical protein XcfCFBP6990P_23315 [Xanthomonas citri pv. phaseoli var. fuscans]|nr:hypothetical protein [Xanthomonas citri]UZB00001.1 hypothetical protein OM946_01670 [Xanthomonas citri pv. fuscans]QTD87985.1 hypothetical protein XcfCFBP6988P_23370 [Xanthomonas citri pv. phaseoli var. fuscans]QTF14066.1 hypothetical protein XcfCFBP6989P_23285 [Xanthomonas citri pv. phaseoli var. fuscans]QTF76266.1 hypothetical protein XcfCFBP6990P_23315 [Xanthomonas citri pv. phaseoli var. fuscans]UZB03538.1 hypothetical protein OM948_19480 [Xanthomonas citri pv. fuscans]